MTLPPETSETILNALASILATGSALFGAVVSRWLARQRRQDKDLACAREKIRLIYTRLGWTLPDNLETLDDVFCAIRKVMAQLDELERKGSATPNPNWNPVPKATDYMPEQKP